MAFDPEALGDQMVVAGQKQIATGGKLKEGAVQLREFGDSLAPGEQIHTSMGSIRDGATSIRSLLAPVVTALQFIVTALNGIRIPTVTPQTRNINFPVIGQVRFVTGITIGSTNPFAAIATRVETVRANFANIRDALNTIANDLRDLRNQLPDIRTNLVGTADDMDSGGTDLIASGQALRTAGTALGGS
jgi:hypothetical protein